MTHASVKKNYILSVTVLKVLWMMESKSVYPPVFFPIVL